jgi:large subunit ribosomal protein L19
MEKSVYSHSHFIKDSSHSMDLLKVAQEASKIEVKARPEFKSGDTVTVVYKIKEGNKEREQLFQGVVLQRRGSRCY